MNAKQLGERIAALRLRYGMTQADLASLLDISPSGVSFYELGKRNPPAEKIGRLAAIFHVPISVFYNASETDLSPRTEDGEPLSEDIVRRDQAQAQSRTNRVRFSLGPNLTEEDIDAIAQKLVSYNNPSAQNTAPHTQEARTVSFGMDKLPEETRKRIVGMIRAMFSGTPEEEYFTEKGKTDDDA